MDVRLTETGDDHRILQPLALVHRQNPHRIGTGQDPDGLFRPLAVPMGQESRHPLIQCYPLSGQLHECLRMRRISTIDIEHPEDASHALCQRQSRPTQQIDSRDQSLQQGFHVDRAEPPLGTIGTVIFHPAMVLLQPLGFIPRTPGPHFKRPPSLQKLQKMLCGIRRHHEFHEAHHRQCRGMTA